LTNEGGSIGASMAKVMSERREQFHFQRLGDGLDPLNPNLGDSLGELRTTFLGLTGDPARANSMAWQLISDVRGQQAQSMAYFDCFWTCSVLAAAIAPLALLMKRPEAKTGAHVIAE
jgi:DHA2 family multidrug resistance protein